MSVFLITIPVLLETTNQPGKLVNQRRRVFLSGHYAAGEPWRVFAAAGLATVGIASFTLTFMLGTNNALFRPDDLVGKSIEPALPEAVRLVARWGPLNATRAMLPLTGGLIGLLGMSKVLVF
ncbi:hypothetical protein C8A03DRAFT_38925 [Achaetomium macrosporum]|uniref:Uncharacterized protein n=1 Tax=Achaetomium macrosporum TaxID=79813 RepID=A0AAN7H9W4_9PEZI|nr:hypothetical protein C8A03DRAFT_38925 [Achaetomium macrosporum]